MADRDSGFDHQQEWLEKERLKQEKSTENWIYVGTDVQRPNMAKIGLTTGLLGTRASGSQNPFYTLLCAFKIRAGVSKEQVASIEKDVKKHLSLFYKRINHEGSGRVSEWFYVSPYQMREVVHDYLYMNFSWQMHGYYCHIRNIGVIYSWENDALLKGTSRPPFKANDLTSPPIDPDCYMPGGCGRECDCWE